MKRLIQFLISLFLAFAPVMAAFGQGQTSQTPSPTPSSSNVTVDKSPLQRTGTISSFAPIVDAIAPCVVSVYTTKTVKVPRELRDYFGGPSSGTIQGLGSGVIVSDDGYILTNNHVADGADEILVSIGLDRKEYKAKKIGSDPGTDLAVLKIDAKNLPAITFADSDKARVGDIVLAVGNPYGLTRTVTMGIISGLGRSGMGITDYEDFIQTDASINPGNSGGALVDTEGRLVGINTAIYSPSGANNGIGFAVPSNVAHEVLKSIRETGSVVRGFLGVSVQQVTQALADAFKLKDVSGALVGEVEPDGPAAKAGIESGDVITVVNGTAIADDRQLRLTISSMAPGTKVDVKLFRNGEEKTVQAVLAKLPAKKTANAGGEESAEPSPHVSNILDGITVGDLTDDIRAALHIPRRVQGVVITTIDSGSAGYSAGLREGFVIEELNHQPIKNADEAVTLGDKIKKGERVLIKVWSKGHSGYVALGGEPQEFP